MSANTRELALARRALRAAITHLRQCEGVSMPAGARHQLAFALQRVRFEVDTIDLIERDANAHVDAMVRSRRGVQ